MGQTILAISLADRSREIARSEACRSDQRIARSEACRFRSTGLRPCNCPLQICKLQTCDCSAPICRPQSLRSLPASQIGAEKSQGLRPADRSRAIARSEACRFQSAGQTLQFPLSDLQASALRLLCSDLQVSNLAISTERGWTGDHWNPIWWSPVWPRPSFLWFRVRINNSILSADPKERP